MYIETERLIIRRPTVQDVDDYMEFCNSEFVLQYNAMTVKSREEISEQLSMAQNSNDMLVLEQKPTGKVIGAIFTQEDSLRYGVCSLELSYMLGESFSRKGYMKEALKALMEYLFQEMDLVCLSARSFAPNIASRRLLLSLGFQENGIIPKCVRGYHDIVFDDVLYSKFHS